MVESLIASILSFLIGWFNFHEAERRAASSYELIRSKAPNSHTAGVICMALGVIFLTIFLCLLYKQTSGKIRSRKPAFDPLLERAASFRVQVYDYLRNEKSTQTVRLDSSPRRFQGSYEYFLDSVLMVDRFALDTDTIVFLDAAGKPLPIRSPRYRWSITHNSDNPQDTRAWLYVSYGN